MKVEARYRGKSRYYPGVIGRAKGDGTYDIDYDDGERETGVRAELIKPVGPAGPAGPVKPAGPVNGVDGVIGVDGAVDRMRLLGAGAMGGAGSVASVGISGPPGVSPGGAGGVSGSADYEPGLGPLRRPLQGMQGTVVGIAGPLARPGSGPGEDQQQSKQREADQFGARTIRVQSRGPGGRN